MADKQLDPLDVLNRVAAALEGLKANPQTPQSEELMLKLAAAMDRMAESQLDGSKLIAQETRRAQRPSNEVVPQVSVFNRRGVLLGDNAKGPVKQPLKCIMLIPWIAEWESLTREEVDLLNLVEAGEYMVKRIDNSKIKVTARLEMKVDGKTPSRMLINHDTAFNNDNFRLWPDNPTWLRQILKQHDKKIAAVAAAILTDEEEEALIEAGELSVSV